MAKLGKKIHIYWKNLFCNKGRCVWERLDGDGGEKGNALVETGVGEYQVEWASLDVIKPRFKTLFSFLIPWFNKIPSYLMHRLNNAFIQRNCVLFTLSRLTLTKRTCPSINYNYLDSLNLWLDLTSPRSEPQELVRQNPSTRELCDKRASTVDNRIWTYLNPSFRRISLNLEVKSMFDLQNAMNDIVEMCQQYEVQ